MSRPKGSKNKKRDIMADARDVKKEEKLEGRSVSVAMDEEADVVDSYNGDCTNCLNQGKQVQLQPNGVCSTCDFDKSKLYGAF